MENEGNIIPAAADLLQRYDTLFGISKNISRSIPNIKDGLKPVQRKILFTINEMGKPDDLKKVGTIMGEVLKIYSHGDTSAADALVRMGTVWGNIAPYIFGKGNYGCHDSQTEVLTRNGWRLFKYITKDDLLCTVDTVCKEIKWEHPKHIFHYIPDEIEMFHYTNGKTVDFCVTRNHTMVIKNAWNSSTDPSMVTIDMIHDTTFNIPMVFTQHNHHSYWRQKTMDAWMIISALYINYGTLITSSTGTQFIDINIKKPLQKDHATSLSNALCEKMIPTNSGFRVSMDEVSDIQHHLDCTLEFHSDSVPDWIFDQDWSNIDTFIQAYIATSGTVSPISGTQMYAKTKKIADQLQILMFLCGKPSIVRERSWRDPWVHLDKPYVVEELRSRSYRIQPNMCKTHWAKMPDIWCAEVEKYHTLVTRRNGCILVSGNSVMGDAPAAYRYIEAKLSPFAKHCFFSDKLCIDMVPTYDNTRMEPETLPAMFPTAVINGATGSGYGQSSNIPSYNLKDVIDTTIKLIDNPKAKCSMIPDMHWGCDIISSKPFGKFKTSFEQIFETGYGSYIQKFRYHIDHEKNVVIVTGLPAKVKLEDVLREIERLQNENKAFPELKAMADLSGKHHNNSIWVEFYLFEGKNPYRFISKLESVKDMKKTVKVNVDLVEGLSVVHFSIRSYLNTWIQYRHDYIRACLSAELTTVESNIAINDIKLFIFDEDRLERTTAIYVESQDHADIVKKLMEEYSDSTGMTSQQAAILAEMAGKDYTKSALAKYKELAVTLRAEHDRIMKILNDPQGINNIIKDQLRSGLKYARPRGARVIGESESVTDDTVVLAIQPKNGTIVKLADNEESQKLLDILPSTLCTSLDTSYNAIIFDDNGRYVIINPGEIPMMKDLKSMVPLNRYIDKQLGTLVAMEPLDDTCRSFIVVTKMGKLKKINPVNYRAKTQNNTYIGLDPGDQVVSIIGIKSDTSHIIIYTDKGSGQRFPSNIINITGASAAGNYGISVPEGETVAGGFCVNDADLIVYVTRKGFVRVNQSRYFHVRKNKNDWVHLIDMKPTDELAEVVACSSSDSVHVVYNDLTTEDIKIKEIPIDTMNSPPRNIAYKAHKRVVHAKRVGKKKK